MDYGELLEAAKKDPDKADYTKLRLSYAASPIYKPYEVWKSEDLKPVYAAAAAGDLKKAEELINKLLGEYYLNIDAHVAAIALYKRLNNAQKQDYHKKFLLGLIGAIKKTGDGKSFKTAFKVIHVMEEYAVLKAMGMPSNIKYTQTLRGFEDKKYDVFEFQTPDPEKILVFFFNVDTPLNWLKNRPAF